MALMTSLLSQRKSQRRKRRIAQHNDVIRLKLFLLFWLITAESEDSQKNCLSALSEVSAVLAEQRGSFGHIDRGHQAYRNRSCRTNARNGVDRKFYRLLDKA